ncbi:hypothetical protein P154DRAFT_72807 [Amniculicola lignicola CBS 123094]|uniref:Zn(2)-C6 fungal-type domain-containing protein n=1 Tax=Amniculicola lignicola CBS 123094 TaxID=1392246 RepID=A0A6A5WQP0_9PLEO|nr:hypothetical protein P154DRAFT_72807 [Amniculicola lignicola CBS 123094]
MDSSKLSYSTFANPNTKRIRRVALACIQCRSRKVRCDATQPGCTRCQVDGKQCEYQKSRRGGRPRRPATDQVNDLDDANDLSQWADYFASNSATEHNSSGVVSTTDSSTHSMSHSPEFPSNLETVGMRGTPLSRAETDQLLDQYYEFFHRSHPCVLPLWALRTRLASDSSMCESLLPVLLYIGSIFTHSVPSAPLAIAAAQAIETARARGGIPSPYYIQALSLYCIAVYWCDEPERGRELLDEAIQGAFDLGMHKAEFAVRHGESDAVLQESWRRTWWTIYVTDAHIAGSTHTFPTKTGAIHMTTEFPCEDYQYESGNIPKPMTIRSYDVREFSNAEFSSFAHFIGFTFGINRALATRRYNDIENAKIAVANADTMMGAWCSLLPTSKRRILRDDGTIDELLFKANILMNTYIADLHRELSSLKYSPIESVSLCAPPPPPENNCTIKEDAHTHTAKILYAVSRLNDLLTLPTRLATHTPFIICMIANMTIAHLSACRYVFVEPQLSLEREKIRLNMGVLKLLGEYWPAGKREYTSLGIIATEILGLADEEIEVHRESPVVPLDQLDLGFDIEAAFNMCDELFGNPQMSGLPNLQGMEALGGMTYESALMGM